MAENEIKKISVPSFEEDTSERHFIILLVDKFNLLVDEVNLLHANLEVVQKQVGFQKINRVEKV